MLTRDDGGRSDELAAKYEDVLRARREATARLPLCHADYVGAAAGTDDDGNDDTPGLRRMRARLRRGRASESRAHRPYAGHAEDTHAGHAEDTHAGHAEREREVAPGAHAQATLGQACRGGLAWRHCRAWVHGHAAALAGCRAS